MVGTVKPVDHEAGRLGAAAVALGGQADKTDQRAGPLPGRDAVQQGIQLLAEAGGKIDVLVAKQDPVGVGMRQALLELEL
mgnify:CR=1 FL=1